MMTTYPITTKYYNLPPNKNMKTNLMIIVVIFLSTISKAQQLIPANEPISKTLLEKIEKQKEILKELKDLKAKDKDKFQKEDELKKAKAELNKLRSTASSIYFYGLSTLSSSEDLSNAYTASGRLAVKVIPFRTLSLTLGINAINVDPKKGVDKDSLDVKALLFPETGNFGIMFNPSLILHSSDPMETYLDENSNSVVYHTISAEPSFAYRNNLVNFKGNDSVPSEIIAFENVNWTIGIRYTYFKRIDNEDNFSFSLTGYKSWFNVPQEGVQNFYKVINDTVFTNTNTNGVISGWGMKAEVQYNTFILYADVRYNVNGKNFSDSNPLKGTIVNVGFATALNFVKK